MPEPEKPVEEYVQPPIDAPYRLREDTPGDNAFPEGAEGLRLAAEERIAQREKPIVAIEYFESGPDGKITSEHLDHNHSISAEKAARDLTNFRESIGAELERQADAELARGIDTLRAQRFGLPPPQDPAQQAQAPQQPAQAPGQEQPQTAQPQTQASEVPPGIDPEIFQAIQQNPKLRDALQVEMNKVDAALRTYAASLQQNARLAEQVVFGDTPEFEGFTSIDQMNGALAALAKTNPARYVEIKSKLDNLRTLQQAALDVQVAQQQGYAQAFDQWARGEDSKFYNSTIEMRNKQTAQQLADASLATLLNAGFSQDDVQRAWTGQAVLSLRDHRAQILLKKAAMWDQAQAALPAKMQRPVPPVQRPGSSEARQTDRDYELSEAQRRFNLNKDPSVLDAARLLGMRRNAR